MCARTRRAVQRKKKSCSGFSTKTTRNEKKINTTCGGSLVASRLGGGNFRKNGKLDNDVDDGVEKDNFPHVIFYSGRLLDIRWNAKTDRFYFPTGRRLDSEWALPLMRPVQNRKVIRTISLQLC